MPALIALKAAYAWCKAHWRVVVGATATLVGFVLGGFLFAQHRKPVRAIGNAMAESKAMEAASLAAIAKGKDIAVMELEKQHEETLARIDASTQEKLDSLRDDPAAFAKHLTKLSRG